MPSSLQTCWLCGSCCGPPGRGEIQAGRGGRVVRGIEFDTEEAAAGLTCGNTCRTRTGEWVQDDAARRAERLDQCSQGIDRLLCRMQAVAAVFPRQHVGQG